MSPRLHPPVCVSCAYSPDTMGGPSSSPLLNSFGGPNRAAHQGQGHAPASTSGSGGGGVDGPSPPSDFPSMLFPAGLLDGDGGPGGGESVSPGVALAHSPVTASGTTAEEAWGGGGGGGGGGLGGSDPSSSPIRVELVPMQRSHPQALLQLQQSSSPQAASSSGSPLDGDGLGMPGGAAVTVRAV